MARATDRFLAEIVRSHEVYSYVTVTSPNKQTVQLTTVDGNVNVDRSAQYRRAANITCIDDTGTMVPDGSGGILTPLGTEVRPYRGVRYHNSDGSTEIEVYPLGVFLISKANVKETVGSAGGNYGTGGGGTTLAVGSIPTGSIQISLEMYDRSRKVARDQFTSVYTIAAGTNVIVAIQQIIQRSYPNVQYDAISTTQTTPAPLVYSIGDDPWTAVVALATSLGCDIYFDVDGDVVIAPPPDIDSISAAAMTYIEGPTNTLVELDALYSDDPGFNGVVVVGQSTGTTSAPVVASSWDTHTSSPTYWLGPYGRVPKIVNDNTITTVAAAQAAADSLLKGLLGFSAQLTSTSTVNPALDAGDVVGYTRTPLNVTGLYSIDTVSIPLMASKTQAITARQNRTAE